MKLLKKFSAFAIVFSMILILTSTNAHTKDLQNMGSNQVVSLISSLTGRNFSPDNVLGEENNINMWEDELTSDLSSETNDFNEGDSSGENQDSTSEVIPTTIPSFETDEDSSSLPMQGDLVSTHAIHSIELSELASNPPAGTGWNLEGNIIKFNQGAASNTYNIIGDALKYEYGIEVNISSGESVLINLTNVTLDTTPQSAPNAPAFCINSGLVTLNLTGDNFLTSADDFAGLQIYGVKNETTLMITANDESHSLNATGGYLAAGIGGGWRGSGKEITISGGNVTAKGGLHAAGIGGGWGGSGENITISGGNVTATGGPNAAGIGGGFEGSGIEITISGGDVTATGGPDAAGIGGGWRGSGKEITISGGDVVTATGGLHAAGIGGGFEGSGKNITISGGIVEATGGEYAAGIGGGGSDDANDASGGCQNISITKQAKVLAIGGTNGVSIGAGNHKKDTGTIGSGGNVTIDSSGYLIAIDSTTYNQATKSPIGGTNNVCIFTVKDGEQPSLPELEGVGVATEYFDMFTTDINTNFRVYNGVGAGFVFSKLGYKTQGYIAEKILSKDIIMNGNNDSTYTMIIAVVDTGGNHLANVNVKHKGVNYKTDTSGKLVLDNTSLSFAVTLSRTGYNSKTLTINETFKTVVLEKQVTIKDPVERPDKQESNPEEHTAKKETDFALNYNLNGGKGNFKSQTFEKAVTRKVTDKVPTKTGYKFSSWNSKLNGKGLKYDPGDNIQVDRKIILYAQWEKPLVEKVLSHPFTDINRHWAEKDIIDIYHRGLMKGVTETLFAPEKDLSRGMMITILWRLEDGPITNSSKFSDVKLDAYYKNAVGWGYENKIIFGTKDNEFSPNSPITREELCTILYRYEQIKGVDTEKTASLDSFKDKEDISDYAIKAIEWGVASGIVVGTSASTLNPKSGAKRAEIASVLNRYLGEAMN